MKIADTTPECLGGPLDGERIPLPDDVCVEGTSVTVCEGSELYSMIWSVYEVMARVYVRLRPGGKKVPSPQRPDLMFVCVMYS